MALLRGVYMRRFLRLLLGLLAGTGALLVVLVALLFFVDVNLYRGPIQQRVSDALGREVVLEGPLTLERSLTPRFSVAGLTIANPAWASRPQLARVEQFAIQVGLLALLEGQLQILALEFQGVDLLLEVNEEGQNNFTFRPADPSTGPGAPPAIEEMVLLDAKVGYRVPDLPTRSLDLERVTARKVPQEPLELEVQTTLNTVPVALSLRAEPLDGPGSAGRWQATLLGDIGRLSLQIQGNVVDPAALDRGEYQLHLEGPDTDDLEQIAGFPLPDAEQLELDAKVGFDLADYLNITEFTASIGDSDLQGSLEWDIDAPRPAFKIRFESQRLDIDDMGLDKPAAEEVEQAESLWDQPLDPRLFAAMDLDLQIGIGQLDGLGGPVRDIEASLYANDQDIKLASSTATLAGARMEASAILPWGERIEALEPDGLSLRKLLKHAQIDLRTDTTQAEFRYATTLLDRPLDISVQSIEATVAPGTPVSLQAEATLNEQAIQLRLTGESLAALAQRPAGPWRGLMLELRGDDIQLDASGSVARPLDVDGLDLSYTLSGGRLESLLPLQGDYALSGRYRDQAGRRLFEDLKLRIGGSDLAGDVVIDHQGRRAKITARLASRRLQLDRLLPASSGRPAAPVDLDRPLAIGQLGDTDLDMALRVQQIEGLEMPVRDLAITTRSNAQAMTVGPVLATIDDTKIDARVQLPWGRQLRGLATRGLSIRRWVQQADLALNVDLAEDRLRFDTEMMDQQFAIEVTGFEASARPGEALQVLAQARLGGRPVEARLRAEALGDLLQRPSGPWRDLRLTVSRDDIRFSAEGSVEHPLQGRGFDVRYKLSGAEIDTLLPLFDLLLPLEGPYSVRGRFADKADRIILDELAIASGQSDIGGEIIVYRSQERPRLEAALHSDQIYLRELIPDRESAAAAREQGRVIPDYELPIEQLLGFDAELVFKGKRLRTEFGDLGYINFRLSLQDGVFRLAPFRVRGWAGALVDVDVGIDASQDPPRIDAELIARDLDYGLLLRQAGVAETVDGRLDVTARLSGTGRTRYEFLADADGQFTVVGKDGRIASRRLDLWGADLITTMLSRNWRAADVTQINCLVARLSIVDGIAISDDLLVDTQRISIGAAGTLNLNTEEIDLVFVPQPKRASLVSLTNPVRVTGTLSRPKVSVTVLPGSRVRVLAGLINPAYLLFALSSMGSGEDNPCLVAVNAAVEVQGEADPLPPIETEAPADFSPFAGCSSVLRR